MSLTINDTDRLAAGNKTETLTASAETAVSKPAAPPARTEESANRTQPVALEVAVSVNGARTVEGSDKREPFSEATKTVLVFGNGAVIRLSASVAPGQLLFLTNDKTKKEVVCQVVKSKNYRNVSGYVELEFTEPVVGFWGMRFPGDRIGPAPQASATVNATASVKAPAAGAPVAPQPVAPKVVAPAPVSAAPVETNAVPPAAPKVEISVAPKPAAPLATVIPISSKPEASVTSSSFTSTSSSPSSSVLSLPRASEIKSSTIAGLPKAPAGIDISALSRASEVQPQTRKVEVTQPVVPAAPVVDDSTELLKQQTARLQEQLSTMLFAQPAPQAPAKATENSAATVESKSVEVAAIEIKAVEASPIVVKPVEESVSKIFETAKIEHVAPPAAFVPEAHPVISVPEVIPLPATSKSFLESDDEVKIPAWLEPLARNSAAPASTQELIQREKARQAAAMPHVEEHASEAAVETQAVAEVEPASEVLTPAFGESFLSETHATQAATSSGSKNGLWIGAIAAAVLLAAGGGWWYLHQTPASVQGAVTAPAIVAATTPNDVRPQPNTIASAPTNSNNNSARSSGSQPVASLQPVATPPAIVNSGNSANRSAQPVASQPEPKKPSLGEVHLSAPTVNRGATNQGAGESELNLESEQPASDSNGLGGALGVNSKQPTAPAVPLPVGGDVIQAKLISSVSPVYPSMARSQHVAGDVKLDALVDANGRVTTMKVISGPALLHQAAMDSLRQWKYQPATLNGKPVPMHLTVTLQFRLQ